MIELLKNNICICGTPTSQPQHKISPSIQLFIFVDSFLMVNQNRRPRVLKRAEITGKLNLKSLVHRLFVSSQVSPVIRLI